MKESQLLKGVWEGCVLELSLIHISDYQVAQTTYWSAEIRKIDGRILEVNDQSTPSTGQELKSEGTVYFFDQATYEQLTGQKSKLLLLSSIPDQFLDRTGHKPLRPFHQSFEFQPTSMLSVPPDNRRCV